MYVLSVVTATYLWCLVAEHSVVLPDLHTTLAKRLLHSPHRWRLETEPVV